MASTQDHMIAELQRANADLRRERDAALAGKAALAAALARRDTEFDERIEQQAATIGVLKVISSTPDDTQPVFEQIVHRARALCDSNTAALFHVRDGRSGASCSRRWRRAASPAARSRCCKPWR
jgi:hypothetical protein